MLKKRLAFLFVLLSLGGSAMAQSDTAHFRIHYVINIAEIDSTFYQNPSRIGDMKTYLEGLRDDSLMRVTAVRFRGTASPDGAYDFNVWLSENRLRTFKELVNSYISLPDSIILANVSDIPWDGFRQRIVDDENVPYRDEVLAIIDEGPCLVPWFNNRRIDARLLKLKPMHHGEVWEYLKYPILYELRFGDAIFYTYRLLEPLQRPEPTFANTPLRYGFEPVPYTESELWMPRLHLKTNLIGLAMLSANLAVEVDLARHWSATLPIYYCGMDWFKSTIKFRNFTIQPEVRYWFRRSENDGFFLGAHFEMSYYNFAFDGEYRYQDYRGRTPALGGGLSAGYRMPLGKSNRWRMEFSVGAGIYPLDYSLFYNTPDVKDGQWAARRKETYIGLDHAAVTFAYSFDLKRWQRSYPKKGGRK